MPRRAVGVPISLLLVLALSSCARQTNGPAQPPAPVPKPPPSPREVEKKLGLEVYPGATIKSFGEVKGTRGTSVQAELETKDAPDRVLLFYKSQYADKSRDTSRLKPAGKNEVALTWTVEQWYYSVLIRQQRKSGPTHIEVSKTMQ